jgi:nanoRNase/pAp phosphatase (c-di-AMP/oligoRNAs hydrolase)
VNQQEQEDLFNTPVPILPVFFYPHPAYFSILKMETSSTSEMLVMIYQTVQHHISGDSNFYDAVAESNFWGQSKPTTKFNLIAR